MDLQLLGSLATVVAITGGAIWQGGRLAKELASLSHDFREHRTETRESRKGAFDHSAIWSRTKICRRKRSSEAEA